MKSDVNKWINSVNEKDSAMKLSQVDKDINIFDSVYTKPALKEDSSIPVPGDIIRTPRMEGKVSKVEDGYVYFTTQDGRNMRNTIENCTVIEELIDQECGVCDEDMELDEVSTELLSKYKTAAGKDAAKADKEGDYERGNKRFSGIVKATLKQFDNDAKKRVKKDNVEESRLEFDKKLGQMSLNADDVDQRHGLFIKGRLIKTFNTKDEAEKVRNWDPRFRTAEVKKIAEGSMGGLNRTPPAYTVSHEKVLDRNPETEHSRVIGEDELNELSIGKLKAYTDAAKSPESFRDRPLRKLAKTIKGVHSANDKIRIKSGDRRGENIPDRGTYESRLAEFLELDEADFGDIVRSQDEGPKPGQTVDKEYNGWTIRYQLAPKVKGQPVQWMAWHGKKDPSTAKRGSAATPEKAFQDATSFINSGAGEERKFISNRITIDFNSQFSKQIVPHGEPFFAKIEDGFIIVSNVPQEGFAKASPRAETEGSERFWSMPMSAKEAEMQKLVPNGRYSLGSKDEIDPETSMFDIHFQSVAQSSADRLRMREPGFTVASPRNPETNEAYQGPHHGDPVALAKAPKSTMQGKDNIRFSELVQDAINTHGLKWAFDYYVNKHGLPPRQFQIFAGLTPKLKAKEPTDPMPKKSPSWEDPSITKRPKPKSWWQRLRDKLPFEE